MFAVKRLEGDTIRLRFNQRDSNNVTLSLSGCTAFLQVRSFAGSPDILLELDNGTKGGITLFDVYPNILIEFSAAQSAALGAGEFVFDMELVNGDTVDTPVEVALTLGQSVTRRVV